MSKVVELAGKAAELTGSELDDLLVRLQALKGVASTSTTGLLRKPTNDAASEWYLCVAEAMAKSRGIKPMPLGVFRTKKQWPAFAKAAADAERFVSDLEKDRVKKLAVRKWCARLLVNHLLESGVPLEWAGFTWGLEDLSGVVDSYFPGYLASGLMPAVLASLYKGTKTKARESD